MDAQKMGQGLQRGPAHSESEVQTATRVRHDNLVNILIFFRRNRRIMPRGDESTDSDSDRDSYSSDSAETEEDYERKDEDVDMELPFTKLLRVDDKTTTLRLPKKAIEFYFDTVLKDGSLTKEGEKGLQDKYRLGPEDSRRMQPPELDDTKLAGLAQKEHRDFVGSRLLTAHQR